jgi:uncharacterized protein (TIGR02421 family)
LQSVGWKGTTAILTSATNLTIRELSDRLVEAQRPIRILDAVKWDDDVRLAFFASGCRALPRITADYYTSRPLGFDIETKLAEFLQLELDVKRKLGEYNPVGSIMRRMCAEYAQALRMIDARGTEDFARLSQELYGSAHDVFYEGEPTLADFGLMMSEALTMLDGIPLAKLEEKEITATEAVQILQQRLDATFPNPTRPIVVKISDGIVADAAAGSDYIKLRSDAMFNERDLRLLEVHEGWVHVGTTLNGLRQPVCTFLSKGPPSSTITQEGLAIFIENLSFATYPERLRRVSNRIRSVAMAEDGADFLDIFRFYVEQGLPPDLAYSNATRVFRGSTPTGLPFTKDVCYSKGFILVYNFIQMAVRHGKLDRIPLLFCGKTTLGDMRTISHLVDEGVIVPPEYLPPQIGDLQALTAWMCYSSFLRHLNLNRIEAEISQMF